ncbi:MAG TPA: DUF4340 domain-containing protein [Myxococcales bacterium]|nr:DUF4340 domain-containing protein [Myxococcales bacterium]
MKAQAAAVHGGLAGLALLVAFVTWQREPESANAADSVVALDVSKSDLAAVRLQTPELTLEVHKKDDEVWVRSVPVPKPVPAPLPAPAGVDGGTPGADGGVLSKVLTPVRPAAADGGVGADGGVKVPPPPPPMPPPTPPRDVRGNELAEKMLEKFAPMRALRSLGKQPQEKLKELGLDEPRRTLTVVQRGGRETAFKVSNPVLGAGSPYLQAPDGTVYLLPATIISQLESGQTQLVDRRLHAFKQAEADSLVVKAGDKQRELVQTADEQGAVRVASRKTPDKPDDLTRNWNDKVWRLVSIEALGAGETPAGGEPKVEGRIEYLRRGKQVGFVDLARGPSGELYLRTEHTAGWVKAHNKADEVLGEIKKVMEPG